MTDCIGCGKAFDTCIDALCINCWREKAMKLDHQLAVMEEERDEAKAVVLRYTYADDGHEFLCEVCGESLEAIIHDAETAAREAAEDGENLAAKRCPDWPIKPAAEGEEQL